MPYLVITRPLGQTMKLGEMLRTHLPQIDQIHLPLLSIIPNIDPVEAKRLRELLAIADLAIFVSPNAIECAMRLLDQAWPKNVPVGVVGGGSLEVLGRHGVTLAEGYQVIAPGDPDRWDSEGLWDELGKTGINWSGKNILFLKGIGGRPWLGEQFLHAGAKIHSIQTYRRVPLDKEAAAWKPLQNVEPREAACLMTSSEALRHFAQVIQSFPWGRIWFEFATIICSHPRISDAALELGFKQVENCLPGDDNLVKASSKWFSELQNLS